MKILITLIALITSFTNCFSQDFVIVGHDSLEYEIKGSGEPWIVLVSGVGTSLKSYNSIFDSLSLYTTVVRYSSKPIYLVNEYSSIFYGAESNELVTVNYEMKKPLPVKERFLGSVYLITDHKTFSAGSIFAEMFKFYNMGKIIGQPTGNLYSFNGFALANFTLPNSKLSFQVSSVYNLANNEEEGTKSIEPDEIINLEKDPLNYIIETYIRYIEKHMVKKPNTPQCITTITADSTTSKSTRNC